MRFALYYSPDAYSIAGKIMGRQSAGHGLLGALAASPDAPVLHATGSSIAGSTQLADLLRASGSNKAVEWHPMHRPQTLQRVGAVYFPALPLNNLAGWRNKLSPSAFSLFGVTHTLSSDAAMSQLANLALPPFKPWDALVCTSRAALSVYETLRDSTRDAFARETGATRFPDIQTPIIPLGVDTAAFAPDPHQRHAIRRRCGLGEHDLVLLSAGRQSFHAKANPLPLYRALEALPEALRRRVVLIEAGIYPNAGIAAAFRHAHRALMPSIRVMAVEGRDHALYAGLFQAADLFVSLSDNVQETFGLTPVEAMAAGLPVIVTDWSGYRETVRHGVDGFCIPTLSAARDAGSDLALRHAVGADTYDFYIGRLSLATCCDQGALSDALATLLGDAAQRSRMGAAGRARARSLYDWAHVLAAYDALCDELGAIRRAAGQQGPQAWPDRPDPFSLFAHYPSRVLSPRDRLQANPNISQQAPALFGLAMANYGFDAECLPRPVVERMIILLAHQARWQVGALIEASAADQAVASRAILWLVKVGLIEIVPSPRAEADTTVGCVPGALRETVSL